MTLEEALATRDEARARCRRLRGDYEFPAGVLAAEYDWGYWDAVVTIMKNCGVEELDAKERQ
jgi:hypothetical protein